ncbi:hypothetical protein ECTPHS_04558 [Ectothiorhodospira sp. PHS-1]|nr:hypothetical protein ECTPHS_04558 [Ectothiorhodospira sp. PHS-1]
MKCVSGAMPVHAPALTGLRQCCMEGAHAADHQGACEQPWEHDARMCRAWGRGGKIVQKTAQNIQRFFNF